MLKHRNNILILVAFCCPVLFFGTKAHSAPFCVEQEGVPSECLYQDSTSCWREAAKRKGFCSANLQEVALRQDDNSFCMIDSSLVPLCGYQSIQSCQDAAKKNGVCFKNGNNSASSDAYRYDRPPYRNN